jgi:CO/xanthine dehydrogenase Mo-binding subunit
LIGIPVQRKEGRAKATGHAVYVDDFRLPGMLYGVTVRSSVPRGRITAIHFGPGIPWQEFTVVRARDIPGANCISLISDDQPCLADSFVNHREEPVLLLAHQNRCLLEKAKLAIRIEVEALPAVLSMESSLACTQIIWGTDNIFKNFLIEKGNIDEVWSKADFIIEGEYSTGAQEQLYLETNGMVAEITADGLTVWGSMQCPYYVHKALTKLFGWKDDRIRVIQLETGGGFGGKEEYPSMIAAHAALLSWKSGKPVKLVYDRSEDLVATTKRHPARIRHRTAARRDGKILGMEIDFTIDGGAYATLTPVVLSRGAIHAAGPYECPNVRIRSTALATNVPPHGAFRGFGAPQTLFALERHMDKIASAIGLSPEAVRRRNFIRKGQTTATGQQIREDVVMDKLLDRALKESDFHARQSRFSLENPRSSVKRGMGIAAFLHGAGFTGSGERYLSSIAGVEVTTTGNVLVLTSGVEMGQGSKTTLAQIVASALNLPLDQVDIAVPDTARVPNSGPTVASRTCMVIGKLVESAALTIQQKLREAGMLGAGYSQSEFCSACSNYIQKYGPLKSYAKYQAPAGIEWDDEKHQGDAYGTFAWAVHIAEVSVDTVTCQIRVEDYVAVQEVGRVIHPVLAAGQIEGGVAQGIGYALYENVAWTDGRMENCQMTNYIIPTSVDTPRIRVFFEENPYSHGPMGAKGLGELPIDGPAPAIVNAIQNAIGFSVDFIPVMPEALLLAMEMQNA